MESLGVIRSNRNTVTTSMTYICLMHQPAWWTCHNVPLHCTPINRNDSWFSGTCRATATNRPRAQGSIELVLSTCLQHTPNNVIGMAIKTYIPIGSMYAIYGNIYHQYTPFLLAYIPYMDPMGYRRETTIQIYQGPLSLSPIAIHWIQPWLSHDLWWPLMGSYGWSKEV